MSRRRLGRAPPPRRKTSLSSRFDCPCNLVEGIKLGSKQREAMRAARQNNCSGPLAYIGHNDLC